MTCAARRKIRQFPTAHKWRAIKRAEPGEGVLPLVRKLGISRKLFITATALSRNCGNFHEGALPANIRPFAASISAGPHVNSLLIRIKVVSAIEC
jgi:hypothetical protein